jgi:hypothetical protein
MFFGVDYNEQNVAKFSKKIEDFGEVDVCYENDPKKPILAPLQRIYSDPFSNRRYLTTSSASSCTKSSGKAEISKYYRHLAIQSN